LVDEAGGVQLIDILPIIKNNEFSSIYVFGDQDQIGVKDFINVPGNRVA